MTFKKLREAREWFLKYKPVEVEELGQLCYRNASKGSMNWEFGDWIMIQHLDSYNKLSRPILAIFTGYKIWDQAVVINFVQRPRAWMYSHELVTNEDINYTMCIAHLDDEIEAIQFWTDDVKVLGHWKSKPSLKELREALNKQI